MLKRWCWNWQTGMVEGHVPPGREGSTPSQRTLMLFSSTKPFLLKIPANLSGFFKIFLS
jgi:hypothetical protein